jgi:hypothetical protein
MSVCKHCGSVTPDPETKRLDQIIIGDRAFIFRVIEITAAGGGILWIEGNTAAYEWATAIRKFAIDNKLMIDVRHTKPCPCGMYGSFTKACKCTPRKIQNYRERLMYENLVRHGYHTYLRLNDQTAQDLRTNQRRSETDEQLAERCKKSREKYIENWPQWEQIDDAGLIAAWVQQRGEPVRISYVEQLAKVIASINDHKSTQPADVAEAIQWQRKDF